MYGETDTRTTATSVAVGAAVRAAGQIFEEVIYPETGHAFFNNTNQQGGQFGYVPTSAQDAWRRTLEWFLRYLSA